MGKVTGKIELQALLNANPVLRRLQRLTQAARRQSPHPPGSGDVAQRALAVLPQALRERVTLVEDADRWLALVETSASAQMLRFHLPRLERVLTAKTVKIVVTGRRGALTPPLSSHSLHPGPVMDAESARHIREAAESIADPQLRDALKRLAGRR